MSGRPPQPRTRFTRVGCSEPEVTVLRISGSLGPRAKPQLVQLTQECLRRNLPRLVLDLAEVDALGGGTARLLNEFAAERAGRGGKTAFRVISRTVRGFLCADPNLPPPQLAASLEEAVAAVAPVRPQSANGSSVSRPEPGGGVMSGGASRGSGNGRSADAPSEPFVRRGSRRDGEAVSSLFVPEDEATPLGSVSIHGNGKSRSRPNAKSADDVFDLDLRDVVGEEVEDMPPPRHRLERATTPEDLRERLVTELHERDVASRVFLFQRHPDRTYYLVTRQGADRERGFGVDGGLAASVRSLPGPGFLVDLDGDSLSEHEAELLGELNCEVAAPLGTGQNPEYLLFLSKETPGDEYGVEELQELEAVLESAAASLGRRDAQARPNPEPAAAPKPSRRPPAETLWAVDRDEPEVDEALWASDRETQNKIAEPAPSPRNSSTASQSTNDFVVHDPDRPAPIRVDTLPATAGAKRGTVADPSRALRRTVAQMRDILSLSQDFDAAFGTSKLLEVLVLSVVSVARVETVLYFAARDGDYRLTHQRGMSPDAIQGLRLRGDATLVQRALMSSRGTFIDDDAQITEEERIWARQHGLQYAVPFCFKDEIVGLLLLGEGADDSPPDLEMLGYLLAQAGLAYDRARLYEMLQDRTLGVVRGLITLIEARNGFDCGSTEQVVRYSQALARELQFPAESVRDLIYGAVLRDVGMLQVSESLLRSPTDLTGDQWESIRRHPQEGASIMRQMRFDPVAVDIVLHHHEAYNGEGYPMGLRGRAIPLGARIVAVAESYVKMTLDRPYRKALGKAEALESLAENWGLRYDPLVVDALVRVVNRELSMGLKGDRDFTRDLFGV